MQRSVGKRNDHYRDPAHERRDDLHPAALGDRFDHQYLSGRQHLSPAALHGGADASLGAEIRKQRA